MISTGTGSKGVAVASLQTICNHKYALSEQTLSEHIMGVEEAVMLPMQDMQIWKWLLSRNDVINEIGGSAAPFVVQMRSKGPTALTEKLL
jgi:hypothetical protein